MEGKELRASLYARRNISYPAKIVGLCGVLCAAASGTAVSGTAAAAQQKNHSSHVSRVEGIKEAKAAIAKHLKAYTKYPLPGPALNAKKVAALRGKTVLYVPLSTTIGFFATADVGLTDDLAKLHINVKTCNGGFLPSKSATCIAAATSERAAAVVTSVAYKTVATAYEEMKSKGIPTLVTTEVPNAPNTPKFGFLTPVKTEDVPAGKLLADEIIVRSHGKAHVLAIKIINTKAIEQEGIAVVKQLKKLCPDCTVTTLPIASITLTKLPGEVSAKLDANPSIDYVAPQSGLLATALLTGVNSAGAQTRVHGVATGAFLSVMKDVADNHVFFATVGYSAYYTGWVAAYDIVRMMTGGSANVVPFDPMRIFTNKIASHLTLTPAAANTNAWYGNNSFEKGILKLETGKA